MDFSTITANKKNRVKDHPVEAAEEMIGRFPIERVDQAAASAITGIFSSSGSP